jgi:2-phospho-L-lactate guanylyltransferase
LELGVLVVPSDLPALDPVKLAQWLGHAALFSRAYLPDLQATGTTLLAATDDLPLLPAYGENSAYAHAFSGAYPLQVNGVDSLRADVDDLDSLARAMGLGCGYHTLGICASEGVAPELVR